MSKWQRTYTMSVQGRSGKIYNLSYPLTCIFDIDIRAGSGVNSAHFMLYNLSPQVRNDIQFDSAIDIDGKVVIKRSCVFNAGYVSEGALPVVFQGNIQKAFFYRDPGSTDVITDIVVKDGLDAVQKSVVAQSRAWPWTGVQGTLMLTDLLGAQGVTLGAIGTLFKDLKPKRGMMALGATWDVLNSLAKASGGCASIYQEKVYVMGENDALASGGFLQELNVSTGIIGTPRRSGWTVDVDMLFETSVHLWQLLKLTSKFNPTINGVRRVDAIGHRGMISGAKDGGAITSLSLYLSPSGFNTVDAE